MKIKVSREELQKKLADIQNIVEKKTTMPILSNFLMEIGDEGSKIYATDLETAIKEPLSILHTDESCILCLPARKLYEISREVGDDIIIESDETEWVRLKSGKSSFRIATTNPDDYPQWPFLQDKRRISINSSLLLSMIEKTLYCAGENDNRYALNGLLLHLKGESNVIVLVGTDGHRLAFVNLPMELDFDDELKIIIPRKAITELKRFLAALDEDIIFEIEKNHIMFYIGEKEFLTKLIEGTYPNYEQVIPKGNDKNLIINREEFMKVLRRVSVMSKESSHAVMFDVNNGELTVTATDPEIGEASDRMDVTFESDSITLGFNSKYILDVLSSMKTENIIFEILDTINPTLLKEEGNDDYKCVIMPMRT